MPANFAVGIRNPQWLGIRNPQWFESGIHYGMESGIQKARIWNLEAGIRNPAPSWILLHGAKSSRDARRDTWCVTSEVDYFGWLKKPVNQVLSTNEQ